MKYRFLFGDMSDAVEVEANSVLNDTQARRINFRNDGKLVASLPFENSCYWEVTEDGDYPPKKHVESVTETT